MTRPCRAAPASRPRPARARCGSRSRPAAARAALALGALLVAALAGCGVDGAPIRPGPETAPRQQPVPPGLSVSGEARIGVTSSL